MKIEINGLLWTTASPRYGDALAIAESLTLATGVTWRVTSFRQRYFAFPDNLADEAPALKLKTRQ